jgi:hypothetical protein
MDHKERQVEEVMRIIKEHERETFEKITDGKAMAGAERALHGRVGRWYDENVDLRVEDKFEKDIVGARLKTDVHEILLSAVKESELMRKVKDFRAAELRSETQKRSAAIDHERDERER